MEQALDPSSATTRSVALAEHEDLCVLAPLVSGHRRRLHMPHVFWGHPEISPLAPLSDWGADRKLGEVISLRRAARGLARLSCQTFTPHGSGA